MSNVVEQMEASVFGAQMNRLVKKTGKKLNHFFINDMYFLVKERYKQELLKRQIVLNQLDAVRIDEIISYVFYYHVFHTSHLPKDIVRKIEHDEKYRECLVRDVAVNMIINEHLNVEKLSLTAEYSPEIAAFNMACSYSLFVLGSFLGDDKRMNGINNLFKKSMITIKSVIKLLAVGNSCDAVILWRHLHELECVLLVLNNADDTMFFKYIKHLEYMNMEAAPNYDELQARLSEESKRYGVKERNAFINYGWLLYVPGFREKLGKEYRLNFKEGLQRLAGQSERHPSYASASKILHPSAWVVTVKDDKFYKFTLFELYRSLVNLVEQIKIYISRYRDFSTKATECGNYFNTIDGYLKMIERNNKIIAMKYPDNFNSHNEK